MTGQADIPIRGLPCASRSDEASTRSEGVRLGGRRLVDRESDLDIHVIATSMRCCRDAIIRRKIGTSAEVQGGRDVDQEFAIGSRTRRGTSAWKSSTKVLEQIKQKHGVKE
jgi:hypothetical protein